MSCADKCLLVDLALDDELDVSGLAEFERHLKECPDCAVAFARQKALRGALRSRLPRHRTPSELVQRIRDSLPETVPETETEASVVAATETVRTPPEPPVFAAKVVSLPVWASVMTRSRIKLLLSGVTGALAAAVATVWVMHVTPEERMTRAVVESHVRALMSGRLLDVASDDPKTVRPWFTGRVDVSPPVKDLSAHGYQLEGARLDYVDNRRAAALIYRRNDHVITLYLFSTPSAQASESDAVMRQGYSICHWSRHGITDWVVSDIEPDQLEEFEDLFSGAPT
jgi:anti-sigma factor RsiW